MSKGKQGWKELDGWIDRWMEIYRISILRYLGGEWMEGDRITPEYL